MNGNNLDALRVQPDIGAEAHMINAEALANAEWWKFFVGIAVLVVIIVITSYVKFNQNIWAANVNGQHDKAEKLKKMRHVMAATWILAAAIFLALLKVYMMPYNVKVEAKAYDEEYLLNRVYGIDMSREPVTSNITFDVVIRRSVLDVDDVLGSIEVDGGRYVICSDATVEKGDMYSLCSERVGVFPPDLGVSVYITKGFTKFKYDDSYKDGVGTFIGSAESVEEAEEIYVEIQQKILDKFAIKIK